MKPRTLVLFAFAALLGAAVAVLPALAASQEATLEMNQSCVELNWPCWTSAGGAYPSPTYTTTIAPGGSVTFVNHTKTAANIVWKSSTVPACASTVPVSPMAAAAEWEGKCTFEQPGTYEFESPGLFYPTGYKVVVESPSTGTTPTDTTDTTGTTSTGTTTFGGSSGSSPGSGAPTTPGSGSGGVAGQVGSLFLGSASTACKLPSSQHGQSVHGSIEISSAGSGGRLEVQLLAASASLAGGTHSARVQVGRLVRASVRAGRDAFTVALNTKGRRALRLHGHLTLIVKLRLTAAQGKSATLTRSVILHA